MFFERFREAAARLPAGLIRPMPPASPALLAQAEQALGAPLPADYASFLRSFDGADLFHEAVLIAGVGPAAPRALAELNPPPRPAALVFAEALAGDRFALDGAGRVWRLAAGSDERWLAGSSFSRWLDATVAREQLLYGPDGEFLAEAFDDDAEEVTPKTALRQAERALRADPGSAEAENERGVALRRLGRLGPAAEAFAAATALDPENPWPWFDLGRARLESGRELPQAVAAFRRAAEQEPSVAGARLYAWAARAALAAGDTAAADNARAEALARDPALADALRRAAAQAAADDDEPALAEADALLAAIAPDAASAPPRRRLPIIREEPVSEAPARRPPPARPRRPERAARPRPGASRPGSKPRGR